MEEKNLAQQIADRIRKTEAGKTYKDTDVVNYTRKYAAAYDIVTSADLSALEKDNVAAYKLVEKSKIWPLYVPEELKQQGNTSAAAFYKTKIREFMGSRPLDLPEARATYVKNIELLRSALENLKDLNSIVEYLRVFINLDNFDFGTIPDFIPTASYSFTRYTGNLKTYNERKLAKYFEDIFGARFVNFAKLATEATKKVYAEAILYNAVSEEIENKKAAELLERTLLAKKENQKYLEAVKASKDDKRSLQEALSKVSNGYYRSLQSFENKEFLIRKFQSAIDNFGEPTLDSVKEKLSPIFRKREEDWSWAGKKIADNVKEKKEVDALDKIAKGPQNIFDKYGITDWKAKSARLPLEYIKRTGGLAVETVTVDEVIKKFGYKNVVFGNYVNNKERKENLKHFLGSMLDLHEMINMDVKAINQIGGLDINFGSTGCGAFSRAMACYFPKQKAINLTKKRGDGSLAHEWSHYLDNILADGPARSATNSGMATDGKKAYLNKQNIQTLFLEFRNWLTTGGVQDNEIEVTFYAQRKYSFRVYGTTLEESIANLQAKYPNYAKYANAEDPNLIKYYGWLAYKFNDKQPLTVKLKTNATAYWIKSSYYGHEYWTDMDEMFARAFAWFIEDKLKRNNRVSNYLVDNRAGMGLLAIMIPEKDWPFPYEPSEREWLRDWFERLFSAIRTTYEIAPFYWDTIERSDEYTDYAPKTNAEEEAGVTVVHSGTGDFEEEIENYPKEYSFKAIKTNGKIYYQARSKERPLNLYIHKKVHTYVVASRTEDNEFIEIDLPPFKTLHEAKTYVAENEIQPIIQNESENGSVSVQQFPLQYKEIKSSNLDESAKRQKPAEYVKFNPPVMGANGNKLIGYVWKYEWVEIPAKEGDFIQKRVSDWNQAEQSAETGRNIVHQFDVQYTDGEIKSMSLESLYGALGFTDNVSKEKLTKTANIVKNLAKNRFILETLIQRKKIYDETIEKIISKGFPKITHEKPKEGEGTVAKWHMGDALIWDTGEQVYDKVLDKTITQYSDEISQERLETLKDNYIRSEYEKFGLNFYQDQNLSNKISKQKEIIAKYEKQFAEKNIQANTDNELEKGIAVEQEHKETFEKVAAGKIGIEEAIKETAEEHIKEDPQYYDKLEKMENKSFQVGDSVHIIDENKTGFVKSAEGDVYKVQSISGLKDYHVSQLQAVKDDKDIEAEQSASEETLQAIEQAVNAEDTPEQVEVENLPITTSIVSMDDIPYNAAYNAYRWSSFSPEKRAESIRNDYVKGMTEQYNEFLEIAKTDAQKSILNIEWQRYRKNYLSRYLGYLNALSQTASPMITGPARFPTARNQKKLDLAQRRYTEFSAWDKKAVAAINKAILAGRTEEEATDAEWEALKKEIGRSAQTIINIDKGIERGYNRALFVSSIKGKLERLAYNGKKDLVDRALDYLKNLNSTAPKPIITANNAIWNLGETAADKKVEQEAKKESQGVEILYHGARIFENNQAERIQIFFDTIPNAQIRDALKSEAWKWAPSQQAWVRMLTRASLSSAEKILDRFFTKKDIIEEPEFTETEQTAEIQPEAVETKELQPTTMETIIKPGQIYHNNRNVLNYVINKVDTETQLVTYGELGQKQRPIDLDTLSVPAFTQLINDNVYVLQKNLQGLAIENVQAGDLIVTSNGTLLRVSRIKNDGEFITFFSDDGEAFKKRVGTTIAVKTETFTTPVSPVTVFEFFDFVFQRAINPLLVKYGWSYNMTPFKTGRSYALESLKNNDVAYGTGVINLAVREFVNPFTVRIDGELKTKSAFDGANFIIEEIFTEANADKAGVDKAKESMDSIFNLATQYIVNMQKKEEPVIDEPKNAEAPSTKITEDVQNVAKDNFERAKEAVKHAVETHRNKHYIASLVPLAFQDLSSDLNLLQEVFSWNMKLPTNVRMPQFVYDIDAGMPEITSKLEQEHKSIWDYLSPTLLKKSPAKLSYTVSPDDKTFMKLNSAFVAKDDLRPHMSSTHFDENGAASTNAHMLLFSPYKKGDKKHKGNYCFTKLCWTNEKDIKQANYPDYQKVVPFTYEEKILIQGLPLLNYLETIKHWKQYNEHTEASIFLLGDTYFGFNVNYLHTVIKALFEIGIENIEVRFGPKNRGIVFCEAGTYDELDKWKKPFILLMPTMLNFNYETTVNGNETYIFYYDFQKMAEVTPRGGVESSFTSGNDLPIKDDKKTQVAEPVKLTLDDYKASLEGAKVALEFEEDDQRKEDLQAYIDGLELVIEIGID